LVVARIAEQLKIVEIVGASRNVVNFLSRLATQPTLPTVTLEDGFSKRVRQPSPELVITTTQNVSEFDLDGLGDVGPMVAAVEPATPSIPDPFRLMGTEL
jgi:hypothetical protein